ncbi:cholesterol 24-hydroxylase-like isoform X1 [Hemiscyllium ocellatum]|uniref:cholesterol 24-hydroxylase-like isoform X1 n=1 Tax=Hemiscyllium ocellatum TaxID=170820 RepID=UPI002966A397|nr:cholesterol 24-hydroxylase-like isoform X1 [Hemiscyllium ocellatum]
MDLWQSLLACLYWAATWFLIGLFGVVLAYLCYVHYIHLKFDHIPGPPRDSFLFGHGPSLQRSMEDYKLIHDKFLEWSEKYGPVVRLNVLHRVSIIVTHPETIKEFLMSPKYPKDPYTYDLLFNLFGKRFLGRGLLTDTDHRHWYMQRRVMDPSFSHSYLVGLMDVFNEKAEHLMEKLRDLSDGETPVGMHSKLNCVTLEVITTVAFGMQLNLLDGARSPFPHAISMILKGISHYVQNPYMQYLPQHRPFVKEVWDSLELLRSTGKRCIEERKRAVKNGEDVPRDILSNILKSAEQEGEYDDGLMLDNFITFFIAGQETTANLIAFVIMELTRQPEIRTKLQAEVDEVVGLKSDVTADDIGRLQYMNQVIKETLRLYPPGPGTSRWLSQEMVIEGIKVPGGVSVIFNTYIMGRMAKFFDDPLTFDPERFHPNAPKPYYCYFPFTLGPRSCLGQVFAQMEAKVILSKFLQRFDFRHAPGQTYEIMDTGTLRPRDGAMCILTPRSESSKG